MARKGSSMMVMLAKVTAMASGSGRRGRRITGIARMTTPMR
jgi:hypothetical protein